MTIPSAGEYVEKLISHMLLVRIKDDTATLENSLAVSHKTKIFLVLEI